MPENPYKSPGRLNKTATAPTALQMQARRSFRALALVLLLPAVYNYWEFDVHVVSRLPGRFPVILRVAVLLAFVVGGALVWFFGLPVLEAISRFVRVVFARGADANAWQEVLYRTLNRVPYLAVDGAALWVMWVFGFYEMQASFFPISLAVAISAHVLAACWYVPLIYRWYRLAVVADAPGKPLKQTTAASGPPRGRQ